MRAGLGTRLATAAARIRTDLTLGGFDVALTAGAYLTILIVRFDGNVPSPYWDRFVGFIPIAVAAHLGAYWVWGLYGQMWRYASINEARRVVLGGLSAMAVLLAIALPGAGRMPLSVLILGGLVTIVLTGASRFHSRLFAFRRSTEARAGTRLVVVGAGEGGAAILRELLRNPGAGLVPVAVIDDDARKHGFSLLGIPVVGGIEVLGPTVRRYRAQQVLLAIPSADADVVKRAANAADGEGVPLKVLPSVRELFGGEPTVRDVRDLAIEDLLGRQQVDIDLAQVSALLSGRTVLITGAGGSIGTEIVRQVAELGPRGLILVDHDETHLYDAASAIDADVDQVLADIRHAEQMLEVFDTYRPDVVFHAAAHKHVPLLELHPCEAVRTNVFGTVNVLRAAAKVDVPRLVFISTDKAVRPVSVMGASKWLGEQVVASLSGPDRVWCAVRFGNVLGSRGSVIPTFARQIAAGGPVTVTDPRMKRFFMSVQESIQLVLQAAVLADDGHIFELEMGEPVEILDLAERMIRLSGRSAGVDVPIRFTGVRPGEKLEEDLRTPDETARPTPHPSIVCLTPRLLNPHALESGLRSLAEAVRDNDDIAAADNLFALATAGGTAARQNGQAFDLAALERAAGQLWIPSAT